MKYKKGDRFLVEAEYISKMSDRDWHVVSVAGAGQVCIGGIELENAKKIEPEYEEGEWYWCKWTDSPNERCIPWEYSEGRFEMRGLVEKPSALHYIGPKCERPEE